MIIMSKIFDKRINSMNLYVEITFGEYLKYAKKLIKNNELQRKRVRTSKSVYALLKTDLISGCVMPPIVLAITSEEVVSAELSNKELGEYMNGHNDEILILDGLQRTYTLLDAEQEVLKNGTEMEFYDNKLRLEVYININKFGILYRMLTLNTGQTPMSARHQLEMLYNGMLNTEIEGIRLVSDVQGSAKSDNNEFEFKSTIEGFNSYMNRSELPMDRQEMLENIKMLENMSEEDVREDLFKEFLEIYINVFNALRAVTNDYEVQEEDLQEYEIVSSPFGKRVSKIFSTSQSLTGFGSAIGIMKDKEIVVKFIDLDCTIKKIVEMNEGIDWLMELLKRMDIIKNNSKKIGNAQRMFMQYFFRELFNPESDSYANLLLSVENGYRKYDSQVN